MINYIKNRLQGTVLPGIKHLSLIKHLDQRGWFGECYNLPELKEYGFREGFVQTNIAFSNHGVLRGMHRQDQTKVVQVLSGSIFDVALNPETKEWCGVVLNEGDCLYIPPQYAHGYLVLSATALVQYAVDKPYNVSKEEAFHWGAYNINWPLAIDPVLSNKDRDL